MSVSRSRPLASALVLGVFACVALVALDWWMSPRLEVPSIGTAQAPTLDGDISDEAWRLARPVTVLTRHGGDFGGSGESKVVVRAVHDSQYVYLALEWDDPTRSLEYMPLFKDSDGWHRLQSDAQTADDRRFYDDRIAVMLAKPGLALIGGAIHLGHQPLPGAPGSTTGRGLHYTAPGKMVDLSIWHAALGALTDRVQDDYLGPPQPFTAAQMAGTERYLGGIAEDDPDHPVAAPNFVAGTGDAASPAQPLRLPWSDTTTMERIKLESDASDPAGQDALWALRASASKPFTPDEDARFAPGAVIPGVVIDDSIAAGPQDVVGRGAWAGGHWVLELRRSLQAGDKDVDFKSGIMLWFAVFDHSQTRHTYHLRPLIVEMQ